MTVANFMDWFKETGLNPDYTEMYIEDKSYNTFDIESENLEIDSGNVIFFIDWIGLQSCQK